MFRNTTEIFLFILLGIFIIPYIIFKVFKTNRYAPLPVVQIIAGVLFGPSIFGLFFEQQYLTLFTEDTKKMLSGLAVFAVISFVFTAGVEVNLSKSWQNKKDTLTTSFFALVSPMILGSSFAILLSFNEKWIGKEADQWQFILSVGMAMAVTALPILVLLLDKMGILKADLGARCLRYASFDDVAIWTVFALILLDWEKLLRQSIFFTVYVLIAYIIIKHADKIKNEDRIYFSIFWLISCSYMSDWAGLHYIVGAFLAGFVLKEEWLGSETLENLRKYILILLMPVFFLNTGLRTEWELSDISVVYIAIALFAVQAIGKIVGIRISGMLLKWNSKETTTIGWLLQTKALIEIIFCTIMLDKGIISSSMFTALLFMAIMSTVVTTPIVSKRLVKYHQSQIAQ